MSKLLLIIVHIFSCCSFVISQQSPWTKVNLQSNDSRFSFSYEHYYSGGGMGSNYENIRYTVQNNTSTNYTLKIEVTIDFTCNRSKTYLLGINKIVFLPANTIWDHKSDWLHSEYTDWSKKDCLIKIAEGKYTTITNVRFKLVEVLNRDTNSVEGDTANEDTTDGENGNGDNTHNEEATGGNDINSSCRPQGLSMKGKAGERCAEFVWLSEATLSANADGSVTSTISPDKFIFSFKKSTSIIWEERKVEGYQMGFTLNGLDPCEKYDVRLQRDCGNGKLSSFSKTLSFTTDCPAPHEIRAINITSTTVNISNRKMPSAQYCPGNANQNPPMRILEYKTVTSDWIIKVCVAGQECPITNLKPNTAYQVRVKYQYENNKFSEYSKVVNFQTLP